MFVGKLKLPPEPVSPASKPTRARRVHCQKRNGCKSCRLVCWKASVIVSTAEIGKVHLGIKASAARYCEAESGANQIFGKRKGTAKTSRSRFACLDSRGGCHYVFLIRNGGLRLDLISMHA